MSSQGYFDTLAEVIHYAVNKAAEQRAPLANPEEASARMSAEPVNYRETRSFNFEIESYKDRPTKKFFHVVIYRLDSGRYELTTYVL